MRPGCVERCPACPHRSLASAESGERKSGFLRAKLALWGPALRPLQAPAEDKRWGYREKVALRAAWDEAERAWRFGLHRRAPGARKPELVAIPDCPVQSARVNRALAAASGALPGPSELPLAFAAFSGSIVTWVVKSAREPAIDWGSVCDWKALGLGSVYVNLNPSAGNRVFSSRGWRHVWGEAWGRSRLAGHEFPYGPASFLQVHSELYEAALSEAIGFLAPCAGDRVLDLCCGVGALSRLCLDRGASLLGIELSGEAVQAYRKANPGADCLQGRVSERIPQLREWIARAERALLAFVNPPRTGLEPGAATFLAREARPRRLAYLSCSAGTLARDLAVFAQAGYAVRRITPYDFFPQTQHVEALACLELDPADRVPGRVDPRRHSRPH